MSERVRKGSLIALLTVVPGAAWAQAGAPAPKPAPAPAARDTPPPALTAPPKAAAPPPMVAPVPEQRLDARDAVKRALRNNAQYRGAVIDVRTAEQNVIAQEGNYPYVYEANAGYTHGVSPQLNDDDSVRGSSVNRSYTVGSALKRTFPTGTFGEVRVTGERFDNDANSDFGDRSRTGYGVSGRVTLRQPLLRGFGTTVGEAELRQARIGKTIADKAYRRLTSQLVRDTLSSYWKLWYANEALEIQRAALELAKRQETEADARVKGGALSMAELLSFQTRVASIEEEVVRAEVTLRQGSLDLGQLLGSNDENTPQFVAVNEPPAVASTATRADVNAAMRSGSINLAELEEQLRLAQSKAEVAGEQNRPRLDLEAYVETNGESSRVGKAFERAGRMNWITAHVGAVFELPLDNTKLNAERTKALLAVRSAEQNLKAARDGILADATLAVTNESAAHRRYSLAERTLEVAERAWEAEKARFELGQSIPITVQQAEDELRRARLRLARARVDLAQAQLEVLHLAGKLIKRHKAG